MSSWADPVIEPSQLTLAEAARILRDATKDKSYRAFPMGGEAGHYLRWKRGNLTQSSYRDYESCLDKVARAFPDLELRDFEPPVGTETLEEFLDRQWGDSANRTYNKNLSILKDFFKWACLKGKLHGDPSLALVPRKKRDVHRETFGESQVNEVIAAQDSLRDKICLRLLFFYGLRKGALRSIQFKHFDHNRRRLTVFTKGGRVMELPIVDGALWLDLERHILDIEAEPHHYLLNKRKSIPRGWNFETDSRNYEVKQYPEEPMKEHGAHDWWYGCLANAGLVPKGTTSGERMHKARHTAGQRLLDATAGNLKAVQSLLGHKDISTTGNVYTDWDTPRLEMVLREAYEEGK